MTVAGGEWRPVELHTALTPVTLRYPDPQARLAGVRLAVDRVLGVAGEFARDGDGWVLALARPPVARLEYQLELRHPDGSSEWVCDPGNPERAPGAFGDKSVLRFPDYVAPAWLGAESVAGETRELTVAAPGLGGEVAVRVWSPAGTPPRAPLPLLVAHDGPEYDALGALTHFAGAMVRAGRLPAHRLALLAPGHRDEWYSASARYASALAARVLPAVGHAVAVAGAPAAMGASLGALAMLHAHRRYPGLFGALFLQSGSFFLPRFDAQEAGFGRYRRIVRFVRATLRGEGARPLPVALTCGLPEENVHNNQVMAHALATQGYPATLHLGADLHNYTAWRDAWDPHLTTLLAGIWRS